MCRRMHFHSRHSQWSYQNLRKSLLLGNLFLQPQFHIHLRFYNSPVGHESVFWPLILNSNLNIRSGFHSTQVLVGFFYIPPQSIPCFCSSQVLAHLWTFLNISISRYCLLGFLIVIIKPPYNLSHLLLFSLFFPCLAPKSPQNDFCPLIDVVYYFPCICIIYSSPRSFIYIHQVCNVSALLNFLSSFNTC